MQQTIFEEASDAQSWQDFLDYKLEKQHLSSYEEKDFRTFIEAKEYSSLCDRWKIDDFPYSLPVKKAVNKSGTHKKRIVYSFEGGEGIFLKFIAFQLFRYDNFFCKNCYAFRRSYGVKQAILHLRGFPHLQNKYCLKVDISNYFNSIDVDILLQKLDFLQERDAFVYNLFERILKEDRVLENGYIIREKHGAMAGTPISPFFANVYLSEVDWYFYNAGIPYFRYSDDILLIADSYEELSERQALLYLWLDKLGLSLNPDKVRLIKPGESIEFLGFCYQNGHIDLSEHTIRKTKQKIKRKADALRRWQHKKNISPEKAAIGLINAMNKKFFGKPPKDDSSEETDEFTWNRWFFPNLTTDTGLKEIDAYLQDYIRYAVTGRHYKGNYRIRYETLKKWGYRSLVHEYYIFKKGENYGKNS